MARPDFEPQKTPAELGNMLREMLDPQTPEARERFRESAERVRQTERELRRRLPPREGTFVSYDWLERMEIPDQTTLQTERLLDDVFAPDAEEVEESVSRGRTRIHELTLGQDISILEEQIA